MLLLQKVLFADTLKVPEVIEWVFFSVGLSLFEECAWRVIMVVTCDWMAASLKVLLGKEWATIRTMVPMSNVHYQGVSQQC